VTTFFFLPFPPVFDERTKRKSLESEWRVLFLPSPSFFLHQTPLCPLIFPLSSFSFTLPVTRSCCDSWGSTPPLLLFLFFSSAVCCPFFFFFPFYSPPRNLFFPPFSSSLFLNDVSSLSPFFSFFPFLIFCPLGTVSILGTEHGEVMQTEPYSSLSFFFSFFFFPGLVTPSLFSFFFSDCWKSSVVESALCRPSLPPPLPFPPNGILPTSLFFRLDGK